MVKFEQVDDWCDERKRKIKIVGIVVGAMLLLVGGGYSFYQMRKQSLSVQPASLTEKKVEPVKKEEESATDIVMVDVKGAVEAPGIYQLKSSDRIKDVLLLAGGIKDFADTSLLNLSKKLRDEMVIIVYTKEQVQKVKETVKEEEKALTECPKVEPNITNDACIDQKEKEPSTDSESSDSVSSSKVSINQATLEELMTLPGIGESKAKEILSYRSSHQKFKTLEELKEVPGIGETIFAKIKENITL